MNTPVMPAPQMFSEITECRLCKSKELHDVLDLGFQPPANSLRRNLSESIPTAPLKLTHCTYCNVVQLSATVDPNYLFSEYVWVTATSSTARNYSEIYCDEVLKRCDTITPFVVEIASNDGTFLKQFKSRGCKVLGIDPAKNIADQASVEGVPTWAEFFDIDIARKIYSNQQIPNIIMARNVIPHVKAIHSIVEGLSFLANPEGVVVIEFHYARTIVKELHYDSVYHEHLFFFSLKSICGLFEKYNLFPFDVFSSPISGGSLVLFFSCKRRDPSSKLAQLIEAEELEGFNNLNTWSNFGAQSKMHAEKLKNLVLKHAQEGKLIGYGASARSSTLLNFCGIDNRHLVCIADRSPMKHDRYTPGTDVLIVAPEKALAKKPDTILLLAWNFRDEILKYLADTGFHGNVILPLPNDPQLLKV